MSYEISNLMTRLLKFCIKMFQTFEIPKSSQKLELRKIYGSWDSRKLIGICFAAADRGTEPILHANQTADEQKEIRAHYKAKASERPKLSRGTKALNVATLRVMQQLEQQADSRLTQAADHAVFVDNVEIVGADCSKKGYETMYLCHWTHPRWTGHCKEFQWVPASNMGPENEDSDADYSGSDAADEEVTKLPGQMQLQFTDALLHQAVDISWQNQDGREQVITAQFAPCIITNVMLTFPILGVQGDIGPAGDC